MTLPSQEPLPGLHDIVLPEPVTWLPETVGWVGLLVAAVALTTWHLVRRSHQRAANRYRVMALEELLAIEHGLSSTEDGQEALAQLPALVKRVALAFADRDQVASLTGDPWLTFLDEAYGGTGFTRGAGRHLPTVAYTPHLRAETLGGDGSDIPELIALVRTWIETHDAQNVVGEVDRA